VPLLRTLVLTTGLGLAVACDSDIVGPGDKQRFVQAQAKWNARGFTDYSYEIRTFCFCPPEIIQWTRVEVRNGVVVDAEHVDPDPNFPITTLSMWVPIDSLFTRLQRAMSESGSQSPYEAILAEYDPTLGYPVTIEYREKPTVADAAATVHVRNVVALN
jgi:hypothetical protein